MPWIRESPRWSEAASRRRQPGGDLSEALRKVGYAPNVIANIEEAVTKGIITDVSEVGGYPEYRGEPYADRDQDGMPDDWETKHGLTALISLANTSWPSPCQ